MKPDIEIIGHVKNGFKKSTNPVDIKKQESIIVLEKKYVDGLYKIDLSEHIDVVFYFHKSEGYELKPFIFTGEMKGVFASRTSHRPSPIGITTVKLIERKGNELRVTGLDALDGSPVLDIKSCDNSTFQQEADEINMGVLKSDPRIQILAHIRAGETSQLLVKAAQIHGHFCPGLALGVMAATYAMQQIRAASDGMESLLAITETNNCFADGVQYVTGCTFGNNALIFKDIGKTAFTLAKRDGKGLRVAVRANGGDYMRNVFSVSSESFRKVVKEQDHSDEAIVEYKKSGISRAFATLTLNFEKLFTTEWMEVEIPSYAPSHESVVCQSCGESIMAARITGKHGKKLCIPCAGGRYYQLDGEGIRSSK